MARIMDPFCLLKPSVMEIILYTLPNEVAPELPVWFVANNWQNFIYLAYPVAEALPGGAGVANTCTTNGPSNCLTLNNTLPQLNPRALAVIAGRNLTANNPRLLVTDFFEGVNSVIDETFVKFQLPNANNDQVRVIATGNP